MDNKVEQHDSDDIVILTLVIQELQYLTEEVEDSISSILKEHIKEQRRLNRSLPLEKVRVTWQSFKDKVTPSHFRRMFRMTEDAFDTLCREICEKIGAEVFLPEDPHAKALDRTVPPIVGEVKVAITLRMLAGGSYLDLIPLFDVSQGYLYKTFHKVVSWVIRTYEFPLPRWLREGNWQALENRANHFAEKSNGVFFGPFGANDGLAIRIASPDVKDVPDPGNYYCRKGFYALNVQAICDRTKRFLWCNPSNKGSTHDSAAFSSSRLYDLLIERAKELNEKGLFIAGDSAYALAPFMITPYESRELVDDSLHAKDGFNYHLSSCRIFIECAFGELIMRWGIFWRTLRFDLKKAARIIQCCMLLHNFILDNGGREDVRFFEDFNITMDTTQVEITRQTGEVPRPLVSDNNEPNAGGRRSQDENELRRQGQLVRHRLTVKLSSHDLGRPLEHDMRMNSYGHIYMTS